ncbi:uncharacterized protein Z519_08994 [Cladophialophora bantiana CBS 173.52]|uniref:AB hydrolase-1 domain-containing protein n=1 Tax=Cladophialophora bantiana (strain ATCC 10958 / CBS 173.52 / CDC B-1940 / NIH 8579) TaxID=1442370 RepID=A0A0D2I0F8_CLAB1|nr:uncharacterized protein Z519_08994 [Cladophialophora bantiana CBS 173.52]KIW90349.1 hypothetical protein Z519_08994 [Cladophialophora bantiana CBS 173.52]
MAQWTLTSRAIKGWSGSISYSVSAILETEHQFKCIPVALPSTKSDPTATLLDDIEAVRSVILAETTQGRGVVVVVHSYGGIPGQSAIKSFALPRRKHNTPSSSSTTAQNRTSGHVISLIVMTSGFVVPAKSFLDGLGGQPPPSWKLEPESGFAVIVADPQELFYHDLSEEEGKAWVSELTKHSLKTLTEGDEHTSAGWMEVPVWYLATKNDKAFPVEAQRMFVQMARDGGADITLREIKSSHSPMLSRPEETVQFILDATNAFLG